MGALATPGRPSSRSFLKISIAVAVLLALVLWKRPQIHGYYRPQQWQGYNDPKGSYNPPGRDSEQIVDIEKVKDIVGQGIGGAPNDAGSSMTDHTSLPTRPDDYADQNPSIRPPTRPWPATPNTSPSGKTYTKAIIAGTVAKFLHDFNYLQGTYPGWDLKLYAIDGHERNFTGLSTPKSQGREAGVYLSYIVDHYDNLPDIMVFTHGQRWQWHSDDPMFDTVPTIKYLNLDYVTEVGYASLRCAHWPGCPAWLEPDITAVDPKCWSPGCKAVPTEKFNSTVVEFPRIERAYADTFKMFFPDLPIPKAVGSPCCAQFAVSKEQVLKQPLQLYRKMLRWVMSEQNKFTSFKVGGIMEHVWHILFGRDAIYCEDASECYCKKYGLCDLQCASEQECEGRWFRITKGTMDLPKDWPPVDGERKPGLPWQGWWDDKQAVMNNTYSGPDAREFVILPIIQNKTKTEAGAPAAVATASLGG